MIHGLCHITRETRISTLLNAGATGTQVMIGVVTVRRIGNHRWLSQDKEANENVSEERWKTLTEEEWKKIEDLKPVCLTTKGGFSCNFDKCPVPKCPFQD